MLYARNNMILTRTQHAYEPVARKMLYTCFSLYMHARILFPKYSMLRRKHKGVERCVVIECGGGAAIWG
jgi:hypothetical protein